MAVTYGERMLATAEADHRGRAAARRRLLLMGPTIAVIVWALANLVSARHARVSAVPGAGFFTHAVDHAMPIIWTVGFVLAPMVAALKRNPVPAGAAVALIAGPILSPVLFGPGGWSWWQIAIVVLASVMVLSAVRLRAQARR